MRNFACTALFTLLAASAWAQAPSLADYVKQPASQAVITGAARDQMKQAPGFCGNASFQPTGQLTVLAPAQFGADGKLTGGAWAERVEATGCGPVRALNVLTVVRPDGPPQIVAMMPGDTHTDPNMQKNALEYAQAVAVRAAPPGCKQLAFVDTRFDGYSGLPNPEVHDGREARPWREIWTLTACGSLYDVHLVFTPNARGTALTGNNPVKHSG